MIFSQIVSNLCIENNINNQNIDEFVFYCSFSTTIEKATLEPKVKFLLDRYNKNNRDGCMFVIPYEHNYATIYCSKISEQELIKLIKLKPFGEHDK